MIDNFLDASYSWLFTNWQSIAFLVIGIIAVFVAYRILSKEVTKLQEQNKIEENIAFNLTRLFKWVSILAVLGIAFVQFGFEVGVVAGFLALAGGTIVGFASMNTIGNAIAGIIVMISKPFKIGDRILFNEQFADVIAIDLIYTRMKTLDNVLISIPNQQLLTSEIDNFGKKNIVRRNCSITVGYELPFEQVEKVLLDAARNVEGVLIDPKPYVWVTDFLNFSVEFTLYVFINQIRLLPLIDSNLKRTVLEVCRKNGLDLSTPNLFQSVNGKTKAIYSE